MKKEMIMPLCLFLFAEAALFGIFVLQSSAFALFGFFFLLLLAAATFGAGFFARNKISAKAVLPPTAEKNETAKGEIFLENSSAFPVFNALCEISIKNRLTGEENRIGAKFFLPPKGTTKADFEVSSNFCGYTTAKVEKISIRDIFGFIALTAKDFSSEKGKMTVLPETFSPVIVFDEALPVPEDSESYSPDKKGYDYSEPFQIREYAPGDSIRQIHWKLSEKLDRTIVREPSLPVAKNILLFWDKTSGNADFAEMDAMAETASSVAQSLLQNGFEFILGWNHGREIDLKEIRTEEDILEAIPLLIKSGAQKDEKPDYGEVFEHFGKVICIAKEFPEELFVKAGVSALVCDKTASGEGIIPFDAETFAEDLAFLEL